MQDNRNYGYNRPDQRDLREPPRRFDGGTEWSSRDETWRSRRGSEERNERWRPPSPPLMGDFQYGRDRAPPGVDPVFLRKFGAKRLNNGNLVDRNGFTLRQRDPYCSAPSPPSYNPGRELRKAERAGNLARNIDKMTQEEIEEKARQQIEMMERMAKEEENRRKFQNQGEKRKKRRKEDEEWEEDEYDDVIPQIPAPDAPKIAENPEIPEKMDKILPAEEKKEKKVEKRTKTFRKEQKTGWYAEYQKNVHMIKSQNASQLAGPSTATSGYFFQSLPLSSSSPATQFHPMTSPAHSTSSHPEYTWNSGDAYYGRSPYESYGSTYSGNSAGNSGSTATSSGSTATSSGRNSGNSGGSYGNVDFTATSSRIPPSSDRNSGNFGGNFGNSGNSGSYGSTATSSDRNYGNYGDSGDFGRNSGSNGTSSRTPTYSGGNSGRNSGDHGNCGYSGSTSTSSGNFGGNSGNSYNFGNSESSYGGNSGSNGTPSRTPTYSGRNSGNYGDSGNTGGVPFYTNADPPRGGINNNPFGIQEGAVEYEVESDSEEDEATAHLRRLIANYGQKSKNLEKEINF